MSSIATAVFKATIGLLINKARDTAAKKLKEGDVTDEKFRSLIVREIDQINSKLDGLARKDLLSSISAFKEGIAILFDVFKQANRGVEELRETDVTGQEGAVPTTAGTEEVSLQSSASAQAKTVSLTKKFANLQLIDIDESSKELLSDAKERFKESRSKARDAFSNEGLDTHDRILAMMVRVMATILEKVDNPTLALTPCRVCLEELHALPAVKKSFKIALAKRLMSWFGKDEREKIIAAVCDINHAIFEVTLMVGFNTWGLVWPLIDVGAESVHRLWDPRIAEINQQTTQYIGYYPTQWSFGKSARGICANTKDEFIVGDSQDCYIKVFDSDGNFLHALEFEKPAFICDVATDQADNVYVLRDLPVGTREQYQVCIFDKYNNYRHRCFVVDGLDLASRLTVVKQNSIQVLVLGTRKESNLNFVVNIYEADGSIVGKLLGTDQFDGEGYIARSITACNDENDGRVMVLDRGRVYVFSAEGDCLHNFSVGQETNRSKKVEAQAIYWVNAELVIVVSKCGDVFAPSSDFDVSIYTENGQFVYHFSIGSGNRYHYITGITMNRQRRIALALSANDVYGKGEVIVF